ncbi:MAG: hypothetical protein AAFU61_00165 [Pseudomonadota bacterium]
MLADKLLLGFATNQDPERLEIFCRSARSVYSESELSICLIVDKETIESVDFNDMHVNFFLTTNCYNKFLGKIQKTLLRAIFFILRSISSLSLESVDPRAVTGLLRLWHHPQVIRWLDYRDVLSTFPHAKKIFISDVKDVVFQAPFLENIDSKVYLCADSEDFTAYSWNGRWIADAYGRDRLETLRDAQPICVGTVYGERRSIEIMLEEFAAVITEQPFGKVEQAIFNNAYYAGRFSFDSEILENVSRCVATLDDEAFSKLDLSKGDAALREDGSVVPVIHMYDRFPQLLDFMRARHIEMN